MATRRKRCFLPAPLLSLPPLLSPPSVFRDARMLLP